MDKDKAVNEETVNVRLSSESDFTDGFSRGYSRAIHDVAYYLFTAVSFALLLASAFYIYHATWGD